MQSCVAATPGDARHPRLKYHRLKLHNVFMLVEVLGLSRMMQVRHNEEIFLL